jgi:hypothetical protein
MTQPDPSPDPNLLDPESPVTWEVLWPLLESLGRRIASLEYERNMARAAKRRAEHQR